MTLADSDVRQGSWMPRGRLFRVFRASSLKEMEHNRENGSLLRDQCMDGLLELLKGDSEKSPQRSAGHRSGDINNRVSQVQGASELRAAGHGNGLKIRDINDLLAESS